jgi:hypothetical protein
VCLPRCCACEFLRLRESSQVLPKSQWLPAVLLDALVESLPENAEDDEEAAPRSSIATAADKLTSLRPTGRVVCVLERGWRDYVCTIVEDVVEGNDGAFQATDNEEAVLVVPMDTRFATCCQSMMLLSCSV